jgi:hypothetical protein
VARYKERLKREDMRAGIEWQGDLYGETDDEMFDVMTTVAKAREGLS